MWNLVSEIEETKPKTVDDELPMRKAKKKIQLERMPDKFRIIGGVKVDFESHGRVNYGNMVSIMNYNDEMLCVDQYNDVCLKHIDDISHTDNICFKILDLAEPSNMKTVEYGNFIWLQITNKLNEDIQVGRLVGSKLFAPPVLGAGKLSDNINPEDFEAKRDESLKIVHSVEIEHTTALHAASFEEVVAAAVRLKGAPLDEEQEIHIKAEYEKKARTSEVVGSLVPVRISSLKANAKSSGSKATPALKTTPDTPNKKMTAEMGSRYKSKTSWNLGRWMPYSASRDTPCDGSYLNTLEPLYLQQDTYCLSSDPDLQPWPIRAVGLHEEDESNKLLMKEYMDGLRRKYEDKQSEQVLSGFDGEDDKERGRKGGYEDEEEEDEENGNGDFSNVNDQGSLAPTVPSTAPSTAPSSVASTSLASELNTPIMSDPSYTASASVPFTLDSLRHEVQKNQKLYHVKKIIRREPACVRRVVIRGPPYPLRVDSKCAWKFCLVDTSNQSSSSSTQNKAAPITLTASADTLLRAKYNLGDSKYVRQGGKQLKFKHHIPHDLKTLIAEQTHSLDSVSLGSSTEQPSQADNSTKKSIRQTSGSVANGGINNTGGDYPRASAFDIDPKQDTKEFIPRGERFTYALNAAVQNHAFKLLTNTFTERRASEAHLRKHFEKLYARSRRIFEQDGHVTDHIDSYGDGESTADDGSTICSIDSKYGNSFITSSSMPGYGSRDRQSIFTDGNDDTTLCTQDTGMNSVLDVLEDGCTDSIEDIDKYRYGPQLIKIHSDFATINVNAGKAFGQVTNILQIEKQAHHDKMMHSVHARKLKNLAAEDEKIATVRMTSSSYYN